MLFQLTLCSKLLFLLNYFVCESSCCPECSPAYNMLLQRGERDLFLDIPHKTLLAQSFCAVEGTLRCGVTEQSHKSFSCEPSS